MLASKKYSIKSVKSKYSCKVLVSQKCNWVQYLSKCSLHSSTAHPHVDYISMCLVLRLISHPLIHICMLYFRASGKWGCPLICIISQHLSHIHLTLFPFLVQDVPQPIRVYCGFYYYSPVCNDCRVSLLIYTPQVSLRSLLGAHNRGLLLHSGELVFFCHLSR